MISDSRMRRLIDVIDRPDFGDTKYRILSEIGRGGMGTIYLAQDTQLSRQVAIKVLNVSEMNAQMIERMEQEAGIIARLEHPGIIPVHDVGRLPDGRVFYVMKYVRGKRLDHHVDGSMTLTEHLRLFRTACEAVAFAHSHGVIHRDLKPENIMIGPFGEVLIMDWGIAKVLGEQDADCSPATQEFSPQATAVVTAHGTVLGTPSYMSPEQSLGEVDLVDRRADVYSLGAILYFLLLGHSPPSSGEALSFSRLPGRSFKVPRRLAAICMKAMASSREGRYLDAAALSEEINCYLEGDQIVAYTENLVERGVRWVDRHRFIVYLVLAYILMRVILILATNR